MQPLGVLERADLVVPRSEGRLRWNVSTSCRSRKSTTAGSARTPRAVELLARLSRDLEEPAEQGRGCAGPVGSGDESLPPTHGDSPRSRSRGIAPGPNAGAAGRVSVTAGQADFAGLQVEGLEASWAPSTGADGAVGFAPPASGASRRRVPCAFALDCATLRITGDTLACEGGRLAGSLGSLGVQDTRFTARRCAGRPAGARFRGVRGRRRAWPRRRGTRGRALAGGCAPRGAGRRCGRGNTRALGRAARRLRRLRQRGGPVPRIRNRRRARGRGRGPVVRRAGVSPTQPARSPVKSSRAHLTWKHARTSRAGSRPAENCR